MRLGLGLLVVFGLSCRGAVEVDYARIVGEPAAPGRDVYGELPIARFAKAPPGSVDRMLYERLAAAADLINRFVASEWNHFFPRGRRLRLAESKLFLDSTAGDGFEVKVWISCWGTLVTEAGFSAQETADGLVVGACRGTDGQAADWAIANSFFFTLEGVWRETEMMAALLMHELSHTLQVRAQGQMSYWLEYYVRSTLLLQGGDESNDLEKVPYRVEAEFWRWMAARA